MGLGEEQIGDSTLSVGLPLAPSFHPDFSSFPRPDSLNVTENGSYCKE